MNEPSPAVDRQPVLVGAAVAAGIGIAAGIAQRMISGTSSLVFVLLVVILGGMTLGGYVAGRPQPEVGLTAGGQAALLAAAAAQALSLLYALTIGGKSATIGNLVYIVFIVLLSACFGVMGGYIAFRRRDGEIIDDATNDPTDDAIDERRGDDGSDGGSTRPAPGSNGGHPA